MNDDREQEEEERDIDDMDFPGTAKGKKGGKDVVGDFIDADAVIEDEDLGGDDDLSLEEEAEEEEEEAEASDSYDDDYNI